MKRSNCCSNIDVAIDNFSWIANMPYNYNYERGNSSKFGGLGGLAV